MVPLINTISYELRCSKSTRVTHRKLGCAVFLPVDTLIISSSTSLLCLAVYAHKTHPSPPPYHEYTLLIRNRNFLNSIWSENEMEIIQCQFISFISDLPNIAGKT